MPRARPGASQTFDAPSDSDGDELEAGPLPIANSGETHVIPEPKRAANANAMKAKPGRPTRRTSKGSPSGIKKPAAGKRARSKRPQSAAVQSARARQAAVNELDDFDVLSEDNPPSPFVRASSTIEQSVPPNAQPAKIQGKRERKPAPAPEIPETQEDVVVSSKLARTATAGAKQPRPAKREVIPETQANPTDLGETDHTQPNVERGANNTRKVYDITSRFEELEVRYNALRDLAVNEAESNFQKLKDATDEKTDAADDVIAGLIKEVAAQTQRAAHSAELQEELEMLRAQTEVAAMEKKTMQDALENARGEVKTLHAKLAATRSTSASLEQGGRGKGGVDSVREAQKRVLKEELYSDLTGLIIRDVRRREEEGDDLYDCIQTGRNGTLHFHLAVPAPDTLSNNSRGANTVGGHSYEEAPVSYTPILDEDRDRELLEVLPDYLTEDICFPRSNAALFYGRIANFLMRKVETPDEMEES